MKLSSGPMMAARRAREKKAEARKERVICDMAKSQTQRKTRKGFEWEMSDAVRRSVTRMEMREKRQK